MLQLNTIFVCRYRASTQPRLQAFKIRLEDESWVGTPICRNLVRNNPKSEPFAKQTCFDRLNTANVRYLDPHCNISKAYPPNPEFSTKGGCVRVPISPDVAHGRCSRVVGGKLCTGVEVSGDTKACWAETNGGMVSDVAKGCDETIGDVDSGCDVASEIG